MLVTKRLPKTTRTPNIGPARCCTVAVQCEVIEMQCVGTQCFVDNVSRGVQCEIDSCRSGLNSYEREAQNFFFKPNTGIIKGSSPGSGEQMQGEKHKPPKIIERIETHLKAKTVKTTINTCVRSRHSCEPSSEFMEISTSTMYSDACSRNGVKVRSSGCSAHAKDWNRRNAFPDKRMVKQNREKFSTTCSNSKKEARDGMSPSRCFKIFDHPCFDIMPATPIKKRHSKKSLSVSGSSSVHQRRDFKSTTTPSQNQYSVKERIMSVKGSACKSPFQKKACVKRKLFTHSSAVFEPSPPCVVFEEVHTATKRSRASAPAQPAVESPCQRVEPTVVRVDQSSVQPKVHDLVEPQVQPSVEPPVEHTGYNSPESAESVCGSESESDEELKETFLKERLAYSMRERRAIVDYIVAKKLFSQVRGRRMWQKMENRKVCGGRTWQSMKEHFRKQILPNLNLFHLPANVVNLFFIKKC